MLNEEKNNSTPIYLNKVPMYKILLLGESNVGKTSLKLRFVDDTFPIDYKATIGVDYKIKCINLSNNEAIKLSIWDTAGQERYRSIARSYLANAQGIILCFDICDRNSFTELNNFWVNFAESYANKSICKLLLVGTKLDKKVIRKVSFEEAKKFADEMNICYIETSSMKNVNVDEAFYYIAKEIHKIAENEFNNNLLVTKPVCFIENQAGPLRNKFKCC